MHALDRTGPPMLALSFLRWLRKHHPADPVELVAFRGGELLGTALEHAPSIVALDPLEPWHHDDPDPNRVRSIQARLAALKPVDVTLLVSVAAGQLLPHFSSSGRVVTWVVERGEDLHWLSSPVGLADHTARWIAGSHGSAEELRRVLGPVQVTVVPEFVDDAVVLDENLVGRCRELLDPSGCSLVVVGAGIATHRKAPDLFLEVALCRRRRRGSDEPFVWIGGEHDPLFPLLLSESRRLGVDGFRLLGSVVDIDPWFAAADLVLHPARLDSFPLVCLHAARVGTPVVAFDDQGGVTEMFGGATVGAPFPDVGGLESSVEALSAQSERARVASAQRFAAAPFFTATAAPSLYAACTVGIDR